MIPVKSSIYSLWKNSISVPYCPHPCVCTFICGRYTSMFACKQPSVMTGSAARARLKWAHWRLISIPICLLTSGTSRELTGPPRQGSTTGPCLLSSDPANQHPTHPHVYREHNSISTQRLVCSARSFKTAGFTRCPQNYRDLHSFNAFWLKS